MIKIEETEVFGWKAAVQIKDFPNYRIDKMGNVFNSSGLKLKPSVSNKGYLRVSLSNNNVKHKRFLVHRLVAETFISNPNNYPQVNHKDEDKTNNCVENLEWCSPLYNLNYSQVIEKASIAKEKTVRCITTNEIFSSFKEIEDKFGLSHSNLVACCSGRRKKCGGMEWEYVL